MEFTVRQIVDATGGRCLAGDPEAPAGRIVTDTRQFRRGDTFLALRGERFDGHDFVKDAAAAGAACLVVARAEAAAGLEGPAVVRVADTGAALAALGRAARRRLGCPVIAITGSCGKTTLKEMIGQVLGHRLKGQVAPASFNNQVGVPLTLLAAAADDAFVLCEFGTNAPGEIAALARLAEPTIGAVTLVAPVHLEGLGSLEGVAAEKAALVEAIPPEGLAVLNADDPRVAAMARRCRGRVVTVGLHAKADRVAEDVLQTAGGVHFTSGDVGFSLPVLGEHQAVLALMAAAVAAELGVTAEETAEALRAFQPPPMRLQVREEGEVLLVDDCYNANPASMGAALALLALWPDRRKVFFCGEMRELGAASRAEHEALGRAAVETGVRCLVCVGPEARATARAAVAAGLKADAVHTLDDAEGAAAEAPHLVRSGDVVLVKGSRVVHLEKVVRALEAALAASGGQT